MTPLTRILSDRNLVLAGLFFGLLNCGFGYAFGLPYSKALAVATILSGYFLAGSVCGLAVFGILRRLRFDQRVLGRQNVPWTSHHRI